MKERGCRTSGARAILQLVAAVAVLGGGAAAVGRGDLVDRNPAVLAVWDRVGALVEVGSVAEGAATQRAGAVRRDTPAVVIARRGGAGLDELAVVVLLVACRRRVCQGARERHTQRSDKTRMLLVGRVDCAELVQALCLPVCSLLILLLNFAKPLVFQSLLRLDRVIGNCDRREQDDECERN